MNKNSGKAITERNYKLNFLKKFIRKKNTSESTKSNKNPNFNNL